MAWNNSIQSILQIGSAAVSSGVRSNFSLNAAYSHLASGPAMGLRFRAQKSGLLEEFYAFLDATTGTRGNVSVRCRLYQDNNSASATRPSSTLIATATDASLPASDDKWIRWVFPSPPTLTINENYWIIIDNLAVAPATDFPGILSGVNVRSTNRISTDSQIAAWYTTANGFTTNGTAVGNSFVYVVDGVAFGSPFTLQVNTPFTNNTLRHGALFANTLKNFKYWMLSVDSVAATTDAFEIHDATVSPGSGLLYSMTIPTGNADSTQGSLLIPEADVTGSGEFVVSLRATANTANPSGVSIEGYSDYPTLFDQFFDGVTTCKAIEEISGAWQIIPGVCPRLFLGVSEIKSTGSIPASLSATVF